MARARNGTTVGDREKTASRLLASSARKSYDPEIDVDWDAPLDEDKHYLLPHRVSLYGTPTWERMTEEQRRELGRHEMATIASVGLWFELLLMKMLVKASYNGDATTRHIQYALTEVADECRHVTMFARLVERIGCPAYGPPRFLHEAAKVLPAISYGPALYGSVLVAEEITDRLQREMVGEETVQPLVRMVNHIHIVEEARHVTFAREEVVRGMTAGLGRAELRYQQALIATVAFAISRSLLNPRAYAAVGLDPKAAWRAAHANPHYRRTMRYSGEKIMPFLQEHGLVGGPARHLWRRAYLLP
ncbi:MULTISPECIES: AurF N-oxygenase family protein [unclassified Streptomyces]|uniref:AurF N-oxygenase family protein n=1 Tax=unclassified Streptomyces TaxID=2593676 RepID=UPI0022B62AA7|nr:MULTISPECIES: diiron oxygenase [unclassified Streptomyces]MCZ7417710.1 diiron oxygenase [Streptomyces sp. WMMC897]MCZ7432494.1 diiron oxygenase [Streptomyces sp. WMMC1477]